MIEVSHLSKSYGSRPAVQDLSFTVPDGQIYGLLGPNGAGKSTIMNILTGYLAPTQGEVKVAGFRLPEQAQQAIVMKSIGNIGVQKCSPRLPSGLRLVKAG